MADRIPRCREWSPANDYRKRDRLGTTRCRELVHTLSRTKSFVEEVHAPPLYTSSR